MIYHLNPLTDIDLLVGVLDRVFVFHSVGNVISWKWTKSHFSEGLKPPTRPIFNTQNTWTSLWWFSTESRISFANRGCSITWLNTIKCYLSQACLFNVRVFPMFVACSDNFVFLHGIPIQPASFPFSMVKCRSCFRFNVGTVKISMVHPRFNGTSCTSLVSTVKRCLSQKYPNPWVM